MKAEIRVRHQNWIKSLGARLNPRKSSLRGVDFPDLTVEQRTAPCGNAFAKATPKREAPPGAKAFPVGHLHKQGMTLITPGAIKNGDLQWFGGKKS